MTNLPEQNMSDQMIAVQKTIERSLRDVSVELLERHGGNSSAAARDLSALAGRKITPSTFRWWLLRMHVEIRTSRSVVDPFRAIDDPAAVAAS